MRAAMVAWRYQTTTRRARSAATPHATADRNSPTVGTSHPYIDAVTEATSVGTTHSVSNVTRVARARDCNGQTLRAAIKTSVAAQSAATCSARMPASRSVLAPFHGYSEKWRTSTVAGSTATARMRANATMRPATAIPARRLIATKPNHASRGAPRVRAAVWRRVAGVAQSAAIAASVIAQNERLRGSPDRPTADHVSPHQIAAAPPSSNRLPPAVTNPTVFGSLARTRASRSGPIRINWVTPMITMTQPMTVRRHAARALFTSAGATMPSTSRPPAGVRSRNAPSRGVSPAPSYRNDTGAIEVGRESSSSAIAAPAAARDRTCSTATAPSRRPSAPLIGLI